MNKHVIHYTFYFLTTLILLGSCKPEEGEIGPKGPSGDAGSVGQIGAKGPDAQTLGKNGFISGTATGMGRDGITPINESFRYEFGTSLPLVLTKTVHDGVENEFYQVHLIRNDSLNTSYVRFEFDLATSLTSASAVFSYGEIALIKKIEGIHYKELRGIYSVPKAETQKNGSITNVKYDEATGVLTADYAWTVNSTNQSTDFSNTGQPFSVTGSFSVKCVKQTVIE